MCIYKYLKSMKSVVISIKSMDFLSDFKSRTGFWGMSDPSIYMVYLYTYLRTYVAISSYPGAICLFD